MQIQGTGEIGSTKRKFHLSGVPLIESRLYVLLVFWILPEKSSLLAVSIFLRSKLCVLPPFWNSNFKLKTSKEVYQPELLSTIVRVLEASSAANDRRHCEYLCSVKTLDDLHSERTRIQFELIFYLFKVVTKKIWFSWEKTSYPDCSGETGSTRNFVAQKNPRLYVRKIIHEWFVWRLRAVWVQISVGSVDWR